MSSTAIAKISASLPMDGVMLQEVKLLGTDLRLREGEPVTLLPATNQPDGGYFVRPKSPRWSRGQYTSSGDSIHFTDAEVREQIKLINRYR